MFFGGRGVVESNVECRRYGFILIRHFPHTVYESVGPDGGWGNTYTHFIGRRKLVEKLLGGRGADMNSRPGGLVRGGPTAQGDTLMWGIAQPAPSPSGHPVLSGVQCTLLKVSPGLIN